MLIACEECNHQVSDRAAACPSCGFPLAGLEATQGVPQANSPMKPAEEIRSSRGVPDVQTPRRYKVAMALGVASILIGGTFGLLAWGAVAVGAWALYAAPREPHRRWMAWTGLALGILFSLVNAYLQGHIGSAAANDVASIPEVAATDGSASFVEGMTISDFESNWIALVSSNEAGERWSLTQVRAKPDYVHLGLRGLASPATNIDAYMDPQRGHVERFTLYMLNVMVGEPGFAAEIEDFITAWQLLCYSLDGPNGPSRCADEVAEGLGYTFAEILDWTEFHDPIPIGGEGGHFARYERDGVHWQLGIANNGMTVSAGLEPLG